MVSPHSFLDKTAEAIGNFPFESTLIILPTRRAAAELRLHLAGKKGKPAMLPSIVGVSDFNERSGKLPVPAKEVLLLELFSVYQRHDPEESFSSFAGWGEQLLKDFNEIDLQLIFANDLFRRVIDIREIEVEFSPEEDRESFLNFWNELSGKEISPLSQQFISYWKKLPFVYHDFRNHLLQKNFAYEGLSLRLAAEADQLPHWLERFTHVVYAGFYALNRVEEKFLEKINLEKELLVLKDADDWYVKDVTREAGMFFRKGYMAGSKFSWTGNYLQEIPKQYSILGVPGSTVMAREIAAKLAKQLAADPGSATQTVVILPDENLLFSFLNFCTALQVPVNPSMGFPFTQHALWQVVETIKKVRISFPPTADPSVALRKKEILLASFLIRSLIKENEDGIEKWPPFIRRLLEQQPDTAAAEFELLQDVLHVLLPELKGFSAKAADFFIHETKNAAASLLAYPFLTAENWWKLFTEILKPLRIPFKADREKGVHIMGFLETRVLDFRHVYIASMNEGTFPSTAVSTSLIPYVIRKFYGLPCREEQEAVTAYHFYRLLQRVEMLNLYYDNSPDAMGGGEKSRFLLQLYHELIPGQRATSAEYLQVVNPPSAPETHEIRIEKSEAILKVLETKYCSGENSRALSASAINTFIHCPLKFYLEQVAGIKSEDDAVNALEANILGQILHKAMEKVYAGKTVVDTTVIHSAKAQIEPAVSEAISEIYRKGPLYGHDLLMQEVLKKLVSIILENDLKQAPLEVISTENEYRRELNTGSRTVKLKGYIDRLDIHKDVMRVLDYKTGQDEVGVPKDVLKLYTDPAHKTTLQLLLYLYLVQPEKKNHKVIAGIFRLSRENQFTFLNGDDSTLLQTTDFEKNLAKLIDDIFDPDVPFEQTTDVKRCTFCDFAGLCRRN